MCGSWPCAAKPGHFLKRLAIKSHFEFCKAQAATDIFLLDQDLSFNKLSNKIKKKFLLSGITIYCSSSAYSTP